MKNYILLTLMALLPIVTKAQLLTPNTKVNSYMYFLDKLNQNNNNTKILSVDNTGLTQWVDKSTLGGTPNTHTTLILRGELSPYDPESTSHDFALQYFASYELLYFADTGDDDTGMYYFSGGDSDWHRVTNIPTLHQVLGAGNKTGRVIQLGNDQVASYYSSNNIGYNNDNQGIGTQLWFDDYGVYYKGNEDYDNNLSYGDGALRKNISGTYNTAIGSGDDHIEGALHNNTSGTSNTAVGAGTLKSNTTGNNNTATGSYSLTSNTVTSGLTAIGAFSMSSNTTGDENTAIGAFSLQNNTSGGSNTAIGNSAGNANIAGSYSVYIGAASGSVNNADFNTIVGSYSFWKGTGNRNTFIGAFSGGQRRAGNGNTAIGSYALVGANGGDCPTCTGSSNIAIGNQAGRDVSTGSNNIMISNSTNTTITTGSFNIELNPRQTSGITTGSGNTIIGGFNASIPATTTNSLILGNGNGDIRLQFDSSGQAKWTIAPTLDNTGVLLARKTDGSIVTVNNVSRPYKVYSANIEQTSTSAPVVTVLENNIGTIVWTRLSTGSYEGTLTSAFPLNKVHVYIQDTNLNTKAILYRVDDNTVRIETGRFNTVSFTNEDDILSGNSMTIQVYN